MERMKSLTDNHDEEDFFGFTRLDRMTEDSIKIEFNVESLDNITRGGIDLQSITQFYGEGGTGKTQICLQLALNVQLPPLRGQCIYIAAGKCFPASRLHQMVVEMTSRNRKIRDIDFLQNIHVLMAYSADIFQNFIRDELESFLENQATNVKLVIIDSIADIYRLDSDYKQRAIDIRETISKLSDLALKYNFAIVASNHTVDVFEEDEDEDEKFTRFSDIKPVLGLVWNSLVNTNFEVRKTGYDCEEHETTIRELQLIQSSSALPLRAGKFIITKKGLENLTS